MRLLRILAILLACVYSAAQAQTNVTGHGQLESFADALQLPAKFGLIEQNGSEFSLLVLQESSSVGAFAEDLKNRLVGKYLIDFPSNDQPFLLIWPSSHSDCLNCESSDLAKTRHQLLNAITLSEVSIGGGERILVAMPGGAMMAALKTQEQAPSYKGWALRAEPSSSQVRAQSRVVVEQIELRSHSLVFSGQPLKVLTELASELTKNGFSILGQDGTDSDRRSESIQQGRSFIRGDVLVNFEGSYVNQFDKTVVVINELRNIK